jgi:hypothetical protein
VNSGGEPERDDTGLPPVDIEIPDDARELDRDVQAYYREQRAERRRLRHHRLRGRLTRDGILLPLLACCLILALITGTLLTVFTATSDQNLTQLPGSGSAGSASALGPHVVQTGRPLPAGTLRLAGNGPPVSLRSMNKALLVLVPPACGCTAAVSWLARIGASQGVPTYLVGNQQTMGEVKGLHSGLPVSLQTAAPVALDKQGLLSHKYPVKGLTAVMVAGHQQTGQSASFAQHLRANESSAPLVKALNG